MAKRSIENDEDDRVVSARIDIQNAHPARSSNEDDTNMIGDEEGQFSDDFESDEEIIEVDDEEDEDPELKKQKAEELIAQDTQADETTNQGQELYLPHLSRPLGPDEVLEADPSVYEMLHNVNVPWPVSYTHLDVYKRQELL